MQSIIRAHGRSTFCKTRINRCVRYSSTGLQAYIPDTDPELTNEWKVSLRDNVKREGAARTALLLRSVLTEALDMKLPVSLMVNTPQLNTQIKNCPYPGDIQMEKRIADTNRYNIAAMVSSAQANNSGLGGHIATGLAWAEILEVGLNHYWSVDDFVFFQGHSSPALYVRSFLEGRFSEDRLKKFRREAFGEDGLSSYPHPLLMPEYWSFPTVSMGLGPLNAIAVARYLKYAKLHKLLPEKYANSRVWVFVGDGESDEPETLSSIATAAREGLDNLVFMLGCNLQRLDSTVRTNGKIVQELEGKFRGAGWNVVKLIHGSQWDKLYNADVHAALVDKYDNLLDADAQRLTQEDAATIQKELFDDPKLKGLIDGLTEQQIVSLIKDCGGHDLVKINNAFNEVTTSTSGKPNVILFRTIKGYRGGTIEASNGTHQEKVISPDNMVKLKNFLDVPVSDADARAYKFASATKEVQSYLAEAAKRMGGQRPVRTKKDVKWPVPKDTLFEPFFKEFNKPTSTTLVVGDLLKALLRDKGLGKMVVPITPDEGRTFGWIGLYGKGIGIWSALPGTAIPIDNKQMLQVVESQTGRIIQEGISEAQGMASMTAWGTSHHTIGVPSIPFYFLYSMFGFQRIHDIIYNAQDQGCRGFFCGATAGGTTLNGEGLQHQDRTSYLVAGTMTNMRTYEPAFSYHIAVIVKKGLEEMRYRDMMYYLMFFNENYPQLSSGTEAGTPERELLETQIMQGCHFLNRLTQDEKANNKCVRLLGSGPLLPGTLKAQEILKEKYNVLSEVVAVTSYTEMERNANDDERWSRKHPDQPRRVPYVVECFGQDDMLTVAHSDWTRKVPQSLAKWVKGKYTVLGCDGCGRSDLRENLRKFFEIDTGDVVYAALEGLGFPADTLQKAIGDLNIVQDKIDRTCQVDVVPIPN